MKAVAKEKYILTDTKNLDIKKTFECGQCFRWDADNSGIYTGVASGRSMNIWVEKSNVVCDANKVDIPFWKTYLDLDADYASSTSFIKNSDEYLKLCASYGNGIRILRQDPWEALCSFIISQCNNIPRIKKIVKTLCENFGNNICDDLYSFPDSHKIASLSEKDLSPLRCGYRTEYILDAARRIDECILDFDELQKLSDKEAFNKIKEIKGVGDKVANCFMLYGLHRMDRFPIDTWMKKALKAHFPKDFDPTVLGSNAGLAQQYIFYYARSNEK